MLNQEINDEYHFVWKGFMSKIIQNHGIPMYL